jgi:hypothetical protein
LEGGIADLADIFYPQTVGESIDPKVAKHLALVGEKARIAALAWLEWENIVADEALKPFHTIVAGDADLAPMRKVGESDCLAYCLIFLEPLSIVSGHVPSGNLFEGRTKLRVVVVDG